MDALFDVFNGHASSSSDDDSPMQVSPISPQPVKPLDGSKKRKADGGIETRADTRADGDTELPDAPSASRADADSNKGSDAQNDHKRRRREDVAEPVLTDTFETAESRELAAAKRIGLEGKDEEESMVLSHNIQHQVALPPDLDYEYIPLSEHRPPEEPARTWPFKLDPFQSLSVASIERDESILVSAHTSAGKTVVAEYAIAQCLKRNQRVIYTSPIKALSNQKYRDFEAIFGDVGLMTGDTTINPTASCLVMTTEILRSMLYRGSEIIREVAWVVFDEIHYMRDKVRGVVWEETIILLPDKVRYVFLSATIPNAFQFAEWIAKIHHQACHVVYTDFRPTPLQCYFCPIGGNGLHLVVNEKGVFKEASFNQAMSYVEKSFEGSESHGGGGKGKGKGKRGVKDGGKGAPVKKVVENLMEHNHQPVIFFSFSKRDCENHALAISKLRFVDDSEKAVIRKVFDSAVESLPETDRALPQITNILRLLEKGIGVHHSGLLPIMKETIEILFQESLVKVLFATETFSIGLNMPAKTVVFTQVKKYDGFKSRPLTPSEYIQMSGRAGRRGLDARGIVIMMIDDKIESETFKEIVVGQQDRLNSAFYLGYNMILNLLRIEAISPEFMLERSFHQFQNAASVPTLEKELGTLQHSRDAMIISDEATIKDYYTIRQQLKTYHGDMRCVIQQPDHCLDFLVPGRLVQIYNPSAGADDVTDGQEFGWGVVVHRIPRQMHHPDEFPKEESQIIDVFLPISAESGDFSPADIAQGMPSGIKPETGGGSGSKALWVVVPCLLTCLKAISQIRLLIPKDFRAESDSEKTRKALTESIRRFPDGLPILDPLEHMSIKDESFKKLLRKIEVLESRLLSNPLHDSPMLPELWNQYHAKYRLGEEIREKKRAIARAHTVAQLDELKARKRVLRRLGFINEHEVVQLKARVACEISSTEGHELVISELLLDGFFNDLAPEVVSAILSIFIFAEKNIETDPLKEALARPFRAVQAKARQIAKVSIESKLDVNEEEYVQSLGWQLMETVYAWSTGATFEVICKMTTAYEGTIIRLFRRLEELLRQMGQAANVMGSPNLKTKFEECLKHIRRDLVATQSLFI